MGGKPALVIARNVRQNSDSEYYSNKYSCFPSNKGIAKYACLSVEDIKGNSILDVNCEEYINKNKKLSFASRV